MQPLRTKNNHATSQDNKKSCNLSGQKKSHNLSRPKNIAQPLVTKKNRATSCDKKKSRNATSQPRKIIQTVRTKKNSLNLLGQKKHVTSLDKK